MSELNRPVVPVIAIDGPSGSGKGTVARRVAATLGFHFLDSGALYRAVALATLESGTPSDNPQAAAHVALTAPIEFHKSLDGDVVVLLLGRDVTRNLRAEEVGDCASKIAVHAEVRSALLERQRRWRQTPGLVADGRDMGTVVFPDAVLKVFLTASAQIRAERRHKQLIEKGIAANIDRLLADIIERDQRDFNRPVAPLRPAHNAVAIDSTALDIGQVVAKVLELARNRLS